MPRIPIFKIGSSQDVPPPRLSSCIPALSLDTLQLGIDNVRHDVWLSSEFTKVAGVKVANPLVKNAKIEWSFPRREQTPTKKIFFPFLTPAARKKHNVKTPRF